MTLWCIDYFVTNLYHLRSAVCGLRSAVLAVLPSIDTCNKATNANRFYFITGIVVVDVDTTSKHSPNENR